MVLLAANESRTPVTTSSYFGKPAPLLAYLLRIHKYYVKITICHIYQMVITNKTVLCTIVRGVKISLRYIDPGVKISYDILTPGSIYRGVKISSHTGLDQCTRATLNAVLWVEMAKWPWRSRSMPPIFNISCENPKMHIWCKFGDSSSNPLKVIAQTSRNS